MTREKRKKTEHLHLMLSPEEKELFQKIARERARQTGQRYTVTRLVKERVLSSESESRDLHKLRRTLWKLQKLETELRQQEALQKRSEADDHILRMTQENIFDVLSLLQKMLREGGG